MLKNVWIIFVGAALLLLSELALAQAATVSSLTGTAQALPGTGAPRTLKQGDAVNQGETVSTGPNSSIVLSFQDGQIVALTANSRMAVNTYTYNRAEPAKSNVLLNLAEGGMRAITGLIGKSRPQAVAYRAGNATIGIRGTDAEMGAADGDVYVIVSTGAAEYFDGAATASLSGNLIGMSLPVQVNEDNLPLVIAQTVGRTIIRGQGLFRPRSGPIVQGPTAQIRQTIAQLNPRLNQAQQQQQSPQQQQQVNQTQQQQQQQQGQQQGQGQTGSPGTSGSSSGAGTGGGGLPSCSTVSSPISSGSGQNCRNVTSG